MTIEIKIAVKNIVKKYLSYKIKTSPVILSKTHVYGLFIYNCLVRIDVSKASSKKSSQKVSLLGVDTNRYPQVLNISISEDMWRRKGWYIHPQKQIDFNNFVLKLLDDEFHNYMDIYTADKNYGQIYAAFLAFRKKFDFTEDDMPIKTMEKNYERYRQALTA